MSEELKKALLEHLVHDRSPLHREVLCKELERIGLVSGQIPCRPFWEWEAALKMLIGDGSVIAAGERVAINRERFGAAPAVGKKDKEVRKPRPVQAQETLF